MNKLLTKIVGVVLGTSMAVGVGTAVIAKNAQGISSEVHAASSTYSVTSISGSVSASGGTLSLTPTSGSAVTWTYSSATYAGINSSKFQVGSSKKPQTSDWTFETPITSFGSNKKITSVTLTAYTTATSATYDIIVGSSSVKSGSLSTSSNDYTVSSLAVTSGDIIFTLCGSSSSKAMYLCGITVVYEDADSGLQNKNITYTSSQNVALQTSGTTTHQIEGVNVAGCTYTSGNTGIATVSNSGLITAVAAGSTTITISHADDSTYHYISATVNVTVSKVYDYSTSLSVVSFDTAYDATPASGDSASMMVVGHVKSINNTTYGNAVIGHTSASHDLTTYGMYDVNGTRYDSLETADKPVVDDVVVLEGTFSFYNTTWQIKNPVIRQLNGVVYNYPTYSVTYDANGATTGSVPTDSNSPYSKDSTVTVLGNTGSLTKTGYSWICWNTKADGSGTDYSANDTFSITKATTLYAKWAVTLDTITSIGGTVSAAANDAGTTKWDFSGITVTGTLSGVSNQNIKDYVTLSSVTTIPSTPGECTVSVTATKKEGVSGSATSLTNNSISGNVEPAKLVYTFSMAYTDLTQGKSYADENSLDKYSTATCAGHANIRVDWVSYQVQRPNGQDYMQFQSNSTTHGYVYNSTELPGTISDVTINDKTGGNYVTYFGNSSHPESNETVGGKYFTVLATGSNALKIGSITVTFLVSDKNQVALAASNMNLDLSDNATAPTVTAGGNPVSGYTMVSSDPTIASVTLDGKIQPEGYGVTTINVSKDEDASNIYTATHFIVTIDDASKSKSIMAFSEKANGSATAADGIEWTITCDRSENDFSEVFGINYGTNNNGSSSLSLETPNVATRKIKNVVVEAMDGKGVGSIAVTVGEANYTCSKNTTLSGSVETFNFSGNSYGAITISITSNNSNKLGVKSITILYIDDEAKVDTFVSTYMHMTDYDPGLDNTEGDNSCYGPSGYYLVAKAAFNDLTEEQQTLFKTNAKYADARARFEAWAVANNDAAPYDGNDTVVTKIHASNMMIANIINSSTVSTAIIIISVLAITTLGGYFLLRKRKEER